MAKKVEIKCISHVHMGDQLVRFDALPEEQRTAASQELLVRYLNELYRGKAVFEVEEAVQGLNCH